MAEKWRRGMTAGEVFFQVVLNMSPEVYNRAPWRRKKNPTPTAQPLTASTANQAQDADNPWIKAANSPAPTQAAPVAPAADPRPPRDDLPPWQGAAVPLRQRFWYVLVRGLVVIVLVAALITAVRTWFFPSNTTPPPAQVPAAALYPSAAAGGVAARFAHAYLTWDETNPEARVAGLKAAGWRGEPAAGWDRKGRQTVSLVTVAKVDADTATEGTVTVVATVTPWTLTPSNDGGPPKAKAEAAVTIGLRVPIDAADDGTLTIAAEPAYVAPPAVGQPDGRPLPDLDHDLGQETSDGAEAFFRAFGADTDLSAITAPGSTITGLGGIVEFSSLRGWQVAPPQGDLATAHATVVWKTSHGTTVEQTYFLTLQRTTAGDTARWQILTIN